MIVSLIAAVAENNVIGKDNDLIWRLPKDMKYFKEKTTGHHIITGRKNYISIPKKFRPLSDRTNIILTRQASFKEPDCIIKHSLEEGIKYARSNNESELFIIGGGQIYKEALDKNLVDKLYITHVKASFEGDTFFPKIEKIKWEKIEEDPQFIDEQHAHSFTFAVYEKLDYF